MKMTHLPIALATMVAVGITFPAIAHEDDVPEDTGMTISSSKGAIRADGHAPIGVMGDHMHKRGEWMLSYRYMNMFMEGNLQGSNGIDADTIATTIANRFSGTAGQPATLRIVPKKMTMEMHMFGAMHAPTNWLTLMAMTNYIEKDMDHTTYQGGAGTTVLGDFNINTEGLGDSSFGGLIRLYNEGSNRIHLNLGVGIPTGSIKEKGQVLAPSGTRSTVRVPYAMQLGKGTWDLLPGLTYTGKHDDFSWGSQYKAEIRPWDNREDYRWGDKHALSVWTGYQIKPWLSTSVRLTGSHEGKIRGIDDDIIGPNQTADPDNYGGRRVDVSLGFNVVGQEGMIRGHRGAFEITRPIYQNLNGPQLETDYEITLGWQYAF